MASRCGHFTSKKTALETSNMRMSEPKERKIWNVIIAMEKRVAYLHNLNFERGVF
jgi:hypothetical protein